MFLSSLSIQYDNFMIINRIYICLDVIIEPLLYISVAYIAFQLMHVHITVHGTSQSIN